MNPAQQSYEARNAKVKALYAAYISSSNLDLKLTTSLNYYLERFVFEGITPADVLLVVAYLKRRIKAGKRTIESLLPRNLFAISDNFQEDLSMAKAEARIKREHMPASKKSVLRATARVEPEKQERSAAQILDGVKAFEDFQKMAKDL